MVFDKKIILATILILVALAAKYFSIELNVGSASQMGAGYFPNLLTNLLLLVGILMILCRRWN